MPKIKNTIDKDKLIRLVHKRPAIWDKNTGAYKDKQLKVAAWREICAIFNSNFENLDEKESQEYMKSIIKVWSQTRDSWMRNEQGRRMNASQRPYIYHKQLFFLKSIVSTDKCDSNSEGNVQSYAQNTTQTAERTTSIAIDDDEIEIKEERDDIFDVDCESSSEEEQGEYLMPTYSSTNDDTQDVVKKRRIGEAVEFREVRNEEFVDIGETRRRLHEIDERIASYMNSRMVNSGVQQEDRHLAFFRSIQLTLSLLDDDQVLQFQSGVITLLQNIKKRKNV